VLYVKQVSSSHGWKETVRWLGNHFLLREYEV